jgi:hypothetical protein
MSASRAQSAATIRAPWVAVLRARGPAALIAGHRVFAHERIGYCAVRAWLGGVPCFSSVLTNTYLPWLQYNANRAWANRRADNISWNDWRKATPHMILESTGASATVQIVQVVPAGGAPVSWYNSAPQDGRRNVQPESCDEKRGMIIEASGSNGRQLGGVMNGSWARYGHVDFTQTPPTQFVARASVDPVAGGDIEIRLDSLTGAVIGTCAIKSTGGWNMYAEFTSTLVPQTGAHDIYLVFRPTNSSTFVGNLDWFGLR